MSSFSFKVFEGSLKEEEKEKLSDDEGCVILGWKKKVHLLVRKFTGKIIYKDLKMQTISTQMFVSSVFTNSQDEKITAWGCDECWLGTTVVLYQLCFY